MLDKNMPGPKINLAQSMKNAGMDAIVMTFAVDYAPLTQKGQPYHRFINALNAQDSILSNSNISRTLNAKQLTYNKKHHFPIVIQNVEGSHFLEGDISRLQIAYNRGIRILCLLHDNDATPPLGDVYTNEPKYGGLTPLGADVIKTCENLGILVDPRSL